jgi:hypothetical protein
MSEEASPFQNRSAMFTLIGSDAVLSDSGRGNPVDLNKALASSQLQSTHRTRRGARIVAAHPSPLPHAEVVRTAVPRVPLPALPAVAKSSSLAIL